MSIVLMVPVLGQVDVLIRDDDFIDLICPEYKDVQTKADYKVKQDTLIRYSCVNYAVNDYNFYLAHIFNGENMTNIEIIEEIRKLEVQHIELRHYMTRFIATVG